jgi:hypothetical protein
MPRTPASTPGKTQKTPSPTASTIRPWASVAAGRVAEAREVRRRADDVGERHQERPLEATPQLVLQLVLQTDDLRHREGVEVDHRSGPARTVPL